MLRNDDFHDPGERQPTADPYYIEWREQVFNVYAAGTYAGITYAGILVQETRATGPGLFMRPRILA